MGRKKQAKAKEPKEEEFGEPVEEAGKAPEEPEKAAGKVSVEAPRVKTGVLEEETDIFDEMLDDLHDTQDEVLDDAEEKLIKEQDTREEGVREEEKALARENIKETILEKAKLLSAKDSQPKPTIALKFLEDDAGKNVFIGRKRGVFKKFGTEAAFFVGRVEEEEFSGKNILLDGLNPHVVFVCGARGSGKCLTGDTLITLENGRLVPISELENESGKILGLQHDLKISGLHREGFFKRTVEKILKIRLRSGKEIKLTPEHPLLTLEGWKEAQALEPGSRIATPRVLPSFGTEVARDYKIKLLAYLIAEGHLSNHFVLFSNTDEKIKSEFFESVYAFDANLRIDEHGKPNCFRVSAVKKEIDISNIVRNEKGQFTPDGFIVAQKNALIKWLIELGIYGKLSKEKFIPETYLQLRKEQLALFLNRLFSCDGSIYRVNNRRNNWCVDYASSSEKLIRQVQNLLLRFGILSTLRQKTVKTNNKNFHVFELIIYGENVLRFIAEIGFFGIKQGKQEIAFNEMVELARNPNTDTIPKEVWNQFKVSNWAKAGREIGYSSPKSLHNTVNYAPSREKLLKLAMIEENKGIQMLAQSDIFWDEVVEKIEINEPTEVFDISVPVHHNFVANDIIVHNSYYLGVIAEEIALKNKNVGTIVVDPVGVFWSMRFPNREEKEVERLKEWGLEPNGLKNLKVFIPKGMTSEVPDSTYDAGFSMQPSLLTSEDWGLTFGIDRFSVTGLLLEKVLKKVEGGFTEIETGKKINGKGREYSIDDISHCLEKDDEINSREKGFKSDSIRALISRFEASKAWGIFDERGTPLSELSRANQLTVLDTSFLDDTVTALIVGIISRRLLAARKLSTRKEAAQKFKALSVEQLLELEVPPTWLIVDEAHTLIPSGNEKTPASKALTEYVKQGRRPGCSLVFATQQPSAIDTKILSQLDVILVHKLVFDDDIKAVYKRTPTIIPSRYRKASFVKTLQVGVALTGDRQEETSRAFIMRIRPRMSQHEGRDMESTGFNKTVSKKQVFNMVVDLVQKDISTSGSLEIDRIGKALAAMNAKYAQEIPLEEVLTELERNGFVLGPKEVRAKKSLAQAKVPKVDEEQDSGENQETGEEPMDGEDEPPVEKEEHLGQKGLSVQGRKTPRVVDAVSDEAFLLSLPARVKEQSAQRLVDSQRRKKMLGIFGEEEKMVSLNLRNHALWRIEFDVITRSGKEFMARNCFVDSMTGEFIHFSNGGFVESTGLRHFFELSEEALDVMKAISERKLSMQEIAKETGFDEGMVHRCLKKLEEKNMVARIVEKGGNFYSLSQKLDLPPQIEKAPSDTQAILGSVGTLPFSKPDLLEREKEVFTKNDAVNAVKRLWKNIVVKKATEIYKPVWVAELDSNGRKRMVLLDAVTGKIIS
ncbi:MAG: DUF87 domain-containing protein [Candidatus Diapherotrites archaeon]|nr:DUF87 domain-containing protein [Candidatus Diapherotrites archaeon]